MARPLISLAIVLAAAGCGGGSATTGGTPSCSSPAAERAVTQLHADVAALRHAAALPTRNTLLGNAAVNRATDRFLRDLGTAPIDNLARNRMIDHAAAAVVGACEQCFQALEAGRPIPAIAHGEGSCPATSSR